MKRDFIAIVMLLCLLCCPVWAADAGATPDMNEDSGLSWGQVILLLTACGGTGTLCWQGSKKMHTLTKIEPQPLEVKSIAEGATRKELEDFKADVREDFRRVHQRIDNSVEDIAEIKGEMKLIAINQEKILDILLRRHDKQ